IARVERLAPFPFSEVAALLGRYPHLDELYWAQEEPRNMGAFSFVSMRLWTLAPRGLRLKYVGRPDRASPAEGSLERHVVEQQRIIAEVFAD
ncbi:MAG: hypothetical protein NZ518_10870, partial [Dehalococcoidia bacterium]|nr:hypothetical protein [Dehalococcoidia bacterium]